jgi:hypothetical protein
MWERNMKYSHLVLPEMPVTTAVQDHVAEHAPVGECMRTEAIFTLYLAGLFAEDDAIRKK